MENIIDYLKLLSDKELSKMASDNLEMHTTTILPSEKGFYAFGFLLGLFGAISVQKNTRDNLEAEKNDKK